jgi:hypothetical protein
VDSERASREVAGDDEPIIVRGLMGTTTKRRRWKKSERNESDAEVETSEGLNGT